MERHNIETHHGTPGFFPNSTGLFEFELCTSGEAHVCLTSRDNWETFPYYKVKFGGCRNECSYINKYTEGGVGPTQLAYKSYKNLVTGYEYRGFWIRWNGATVMAGKQGERSPFISCTDNEVVPIKFVAVCSDGLRSLWKFDKLPEPPQTTAPIEPPKTTAPIEPPKTTARIQQSKSTEPIELSTEDKLVYHFFPNSCGLLQFKVRAPFDAHLALTTTAAETNPMYEILLGSWKNTLTVIRKNQDNPGGDVAKVNTPGILSEKDFKAFWVRWNKRSISVGEQGESIPFIHCTDIEDFDINFVGVCTGWGATGEWVIEQPIRMQKPTWIAAENGGVPCAAFIGGEENGERMFVIRALHDKNLVPGKLVSSHRTSLVGWDGKENSRPQYEVLCNFNGSWKQCKGSAVPDNALVAGEATNGEQLFVGRALHKGSMTVGKVQPSRGGCYIPYDGKEEIHEDYEILVS